MALLIMAHENLVLYNHIFLIKHSQGRRHWASSWLIKIAQKVINLIEHT
jgi:hypothetical protein